MTLFLDYVHSTTRVMDSALYLEKAGYDSNGKIVPADLVGGKIDTT